MRCWRGRRSGCWSSRSARDDYTVHVRPELVVEIAFNDIQESPQYPGRAGAAICARQAISGGQDRGRGGHFTTVQAIYHSMTGHEPPVVA